MNRATELVTIALDGRHHTLLTGSTLADLIASLDQAPNAVTTAVNGVFVPRGDRAARVLRDDDAVLLFQPIVGG